ncbi:MAG: DUF4105 domain-containing protein [Pirellulaceae bacterium]
MRRDLHFVVLSGLLLAAALASGCRANLAEVNQPGPLAQVLHLQDVPTETAGATPGQLPPLPRLPLFDTTEPPSNDRDWTAEHRTLAHATIDDDTLRVQNVRNCEFFSYRDCLVDHDDRTYDLSQLQTVDFIMVPFNETAALAHTMLSFGFADGQYLGVSVEVRLEKGESYSPTLGLFGQFELIYVIADERDLIRVRTEYRDVEVLLYRTKATPEMARRLLVDVLRRANELRERPEYYDTLSNNCTTNIVRHINQLVPDRVPYDYRILLPGFADSLGYELGLLDTSVPLAELRRRARINDLALRYKDDPQFSQRIRGLAPR